MAEYTKSTDEVHIISLESKITRALWRSKLTLVEEKADFEVWTHFVGNGSDIEIKVEDKNGKKIEKLKGKVYGNYFAGSIVVPKKAKDEISFTAKLPKHGLAMKSNVAKVIPPVLVKNQKWGQKEARRGDVVKLTADIEGVPDETEVMIHIYEHDQDGAHDFITKFPCLVKNKKIEAEWEYEYHEDTDEIPTDKEMKEYGKTYNPPEYFWVVEVARKRYGDEQESGLLEFKDWIEIEFLDLEGKPLENEVYVLILSDGTERTVNLDSEGKVRLEKIPPGSCKIKLLSKETI